MRRGLKRGEFSTFRVITGAPAAKDADVSSTFPKRTAVSFADDWNSIVVGAVFTGGTTPTVDVEVLGYDEERDVFLDLGTVTLSGAKGRVVDVFGLRFFLRISGVTGNPTGIEIVGAPSMIPSGDASLVVPLPA